MTEYQTQQSIEATANNLLPFPATSATANDGKIYTADDLKIAFTPGAATNRTVRDLVGKVRDAYFWLDESEFKRGHEKFTQFCFDQIKAMKESGLTQKQWILEVQKQKPNQESETTSLAICDPINNSAFGGLTIVSKATEKLEIHKCELVTQEQSNDASWQDFNALMNELQTETVAADEDDELEFSIMRKRHAAKWLKRKSILEQDKLQILQGEIAQKVSMGNG